jgi:DNA-binding transcriptional regulator YiaG
MIKQDALGYTRSYKTRVTDVTDVTVFHRLRQNVAKEPVLTQELQVSCSKHTGPTITVVVHIRLCRGEIGCQCPGRDELCLKCLEDRRPKGEPRPFSYVPSIEARIKAGWQPPNQRRAAMRREAAPDGLGRRIAQAREAARWSQSDLGVKLGRSQNLVSLWERGIRTPGPGDKQRLWAVLELGKKLAQKGGAA